MFCHGKGLCKKLMEREWLTSLGINVGNLQEIGSRFPLVFSEALVWLVAQSRLTLYNLMDCSLPSSSVHGILQAKILEWVAIPFSGGSSQARDRTHVSCIVDSLPSKPPGKPKNTGVGSLFLLQQIFPTQELNWGLLHCRQILYQPSHYARLLCPPLSPGVCSDSLPLSSLSNHLLFRHIFNQGPVKSILIAP